MNHRQQTAKPSIELLENRLVPAGLYLGNGVLSFDGAVNASNEIVVTKNNRGEVFASDLRSRAYGYGGRDYFIGGKNTDRFYGGSGNDTLTGSDGNDYLDGGQHNDKVDGGEGNDWCIGGAGVDDLFGAFGNDVLIGGTYDPVSRRAADDGAADKLAGGAGADLFVAEWFIANGGRQNRDFPRDLKVSTGDKVVTG